MTRSPIPYFGGKQRLVSWILPVLESYPHEVYVEPFGGGGSVLLAKKPRFDVYNDIYSDVVNFYRVLQDDRLFVKFARIVELMPYSREWFEKTGHEISAGTEQVKRAASWFLVARQSFGGKQVNTSSWKHSVAERRKGMSQCVSAWLSAVEMLPDVHARLKTVQIESMDAVDLVRKYAAGDALFYLDPPYPAETRRSEKYHHELDTEQHCELVRTLLSVPGHKVVSTYENDLYKPLLAAGWKILRKEVECNITGRARTQRNQPKEDRKRVECLYCSPVSKQKGKSK